MPIKTDYLKQYVSLRQSLLAEKSKLEARLKSIDQALGEASKAVAAAPSAAKVAAPAKKKRTMSAAAKAKIAAAQKARWAKFHAAKKSSK